jgi:uncharacterized membrane protein YfcA
LVASGRPWLGIDGIGCPLGVVIRDIAPDSPAARIGLKRGDVIEGVDGSKVSSVGDLNLIMNGRSPGERILLHVRKDGKKRAMTARLGGVGPTWTASFDGGAGSSVLKKTVLTVGLFLNSVAFSMVGLGGGVLHVPLLLAFGVDFHLASTVSLFLIMASALAATTVFYKSRLVDWRLAVCLEPFSLLGAFVGGFGAGMAGSSVLSVLFAAVLFLSAYYLFLPPAEAAGAMGSGLRLADSPLMSAGTWHMRFGDAEYFVNLWIGLPLSFLAGLLSGSLGVAGGVLKIMLMVYVFEVPLKVAIGTSSLMVGFTAALGFFGNYLAGRELHYGFVLLLATIVIVGAQIGSRISVRIDKEILRKVFALLMLLVSVWMVVRII